MAMVTYVFFGLHFATALSIVVIVHELAHLFTAWAKGYQASWPLFVPFAIGAMGITLVERVRPEDIAIILAGPLAGLLTVGIGYFIAMCITSPALATALSPVAIGELLSLTVGGDGRKVRQLRREST